MTPRQKKQAARKARYHSNQVSAPKPTTTAARETYNAKLASGIIKQRPATAQTTIQGVKQANGDHALFLTNKVEGIPTVRGRQIVAKHRINNHSLEGITVLTTIQQPVKKPQIRAIITDTDYVTVGSVSDRSIGYYCAKVDLQKAK